MAAVAMGLAVGAAAGGPPAEGLDAAEARGHTRVAVPPAAAAKDNTPARRVSVPAAPSAAMPPGEPASGGAPEAPASDLVRTVRQNRLRLESAQTEAPPPAPPTEPSADLEEALRRLQEAVRQPIARPSRLAPAVPAPPAEGAPAAPPSAGPPAPPRPLLSAEQLARVAEAPLDALGDPLGLADALFLGGHLPEAGALYERLLAREAVTGPDRAWSLFQAANCTRGTDPAAALAHYDRLLGEYPDSAWADAAKVRKALVQWQRQARPETLLLPPPTTTNAPAPEGPGS
jgi:hypothetical protein